jgi:peptide/nickel transport system substrate-binding protein
VLKFGLVAGAALVGLPGCSAVPRRPDPGTPPVRGGVYSHGATGGGLKDTLKPYFPVTNPDISRVMQLYEPLLRWDANYEIEPSIAESVTPNTDNTQWTVRIRDGVEFHHGKTVTAEDVMYSLATVTDPNNTGSGGTELATILELNNSTVVDPRTIVLQLNSPYAVLDQLLAEYTVGIIPTDFDISHPVGTGPFAYQHFVPGQLSQFVRHENYWDGPAWVDELFIYDFADDAAKVNALLAGQVQSIDNLPNYLAGTIEQQGASPLVSETGAWVPFTMRVDVAPFSDVRVRQALRLIVDRQQMIDQALNGFGILGNDLPQRVQDIDQAKSLLRQAGQENLDVELVTSSAVGAGAVESANLFVEQARKAGVTVRLNKADANVFYGDRYLSWNFAQDFWNTRNYIPQVATSSVKGATYNETHFEDPTFTALIEQAKREPDPARRNQLLHDAQKIEYDTGGFIIWGFKRQLDAYSNLVQGLEPHRYLPCSNFRFSRASFVRQP